MSFIENVLSTLNSGPQLDSFGRLRVSSPETLFDSKNIFNDTDILDTEENLPLLYNNVEVSGTGTSTFYNDNQSSQTITVSASTFGKRVRQTKMRFNYQPGKSQLIFMSCLFGDNISGISKREGYFDENNGLFLYSNGTNLYICKRSFTTGTVVDTLVERSNWDDPMDGTGNSGINLDFTKTQIIVIDFEWLGVGSIRFGFVTGGKITVAHTIKNANTFTTVYMSTPNLPIRSEIENDGTGVSSSLTQICASVISEGGVQDIGSIRYASTQGTSVLCPVENTIYAIIGSRLKSGFIGATIKQLDMWVQLQTELSQVEWIYILNPTIAGTFTFADETNSAIQIARGTSTNIVSGGTKIIGGVVDSNSAKEGGAGAAGSSINNAIRLGSNVDGTRDILVLCARPIGESTNVNIEAGLTWREIS